MCTTIEVKINMFSKIKSNQKFVYENTLFKNRTKRKHMIKGWKILIFV